MEQTILLFFQSIRSPALTALFGIFSFLSEALVVGSAALVLYWLFDRTGEQLLFTLLTSVPLNCTAKAAIARPRPYSAGVVTKLEPPLALSPLGDNLSFPSGHVQASASFLGALSLRLRRTWVWVISSVAAFLVACARLYFGVHYPSDVLAGLLFGLLVALFWAFVFQRLYRLRHHILCVIAIAVLVAAFFLNSSDFLRATGLISGGAFFLPIAEYFRRTPDKRFRQTQTARSEYTFAGLKRLWRLPVGISVCAVVFALTLFFPEGDGFLVLKWFLLTGAATLGAQILFSALQI